MFAFFNIFDWQHSLLLGGAIVGGVLVGVGILMESEKWSLAAILVLTGIVIEPIFTIGLFIYDESLSRAQQSTIESQNAQIIALETRLAPRVISQEQRDRITEKMKMFAGQEFSSKVASGSDDAWDLWGQISLALELAGWKKLPPSLPMARPPYGQPATITVSAMPGVMIWYSGFHWNDVRPTSDALAKALRSENILAGSGGMTENTTAIMIEVGPNPHAPGASTYRDSPAP
jgi:hypothetical protein